MSARPARHRLWPTLRINRAGRLDWPVMDYTPQDLAPLGKQLQSSPQRPLDWAIGQLLRDLAETPAALKALTRMPRRAPRETRGLNIAVHCLALTRLKEEPSAAQALVAVAWNTKASMVKASCEEFGENAAIELDALIESCIARGRRQHATAKDVLRDVDADMRERAGFDDFKAGAPPKKR